MKRLLYILLLSHLQLFGQVSQMDSLRIALQTATPDDSLLILRSITGNMLYRGETTNDSINYVELYYNIARQKHKSLGDAGRKLSTYYLNKENFNKAQKYALEALQFCQKNKDYHNQINLLSHLGNIYNHFDYYDKSIKTYQKAIDIFNNKLDKKQQKGELKIMDLLYTRLASVYKNIHNNEVANYYYIKSAKIADSIHDYARISHINSIIGWTYSALGQYQKAQQYFLKALKDSAKIRLKIYNIAVHHGLAANYYNLKDYDKAILHGKIALNFFHKTYNKLYERGLLNLLARVYLKKHQNDIALDYAQKALRISKSIATPKSIVEDKTVLSQVYLADNDITSAEKVLKTIDLKDSVFNKIPLILKVKLYKTLFEVYKFKHDNNKAFDYIEGYLSYKDTFDKQVRTNISEIETQYIKQEKEKEVIALLAEKNKKSLLLMKQNRFKWILSILLISLLLVFIVFAYYSHRNRVQKDKTIQLQKEVHHRLKNNLSIIDVFVEKIKEKHASTGIKNDLNDLKNQILSIHDIHLLLYRNNDADNLSVYEYTEMIIANVKNTYNNKNVIVHNEVDKSIYLDFDTIFPFGLIVNEFVTNAFKYAFEDNKVGNIYISLTGKETNKYLVLKDDGKGLPEHFDIDDKNNSGVKMMQLLSMQIEGSFKIVKAQGLTIEIVF